MIFIVIQNRNGLTIKIGPPLVSKELWEGGGASGFLKFSQPLAE